MKYFQYPAILWPFRRWGHVLDRLFFTDGQGGMLEENYNQSIYILFMFTAGYVDKVKGYNKWPSLTDIYILYPEVIEDPCCDKRLRRFTDEWIASPRKRYNSFWKEACNNGQRSFQVSADDNEDFF